MENVLVEELLCSCLAAEPSTRRSVLEDLCGSHPQVADDLRRRFDHLVGMGLMTLDDGGVPAAAAGEEALPETLGPFVVDGVLGRGGMGVVYAAHQPGLGDRPVALKVLPRERLADPRSEARFVREGLLAARLEHPCLCPVFEVGKDAGRLFLAMPRIEGVPLSEILEQARRSGARGPIPIPGAGGADWRAVVRLGVELARALAYAHGRGLVHRDVKPGNVIVRADGTPVLLDFGLARDVDEDGDDAGLTLSLEVLGTPAYMAPEQAAPRDRGTDARTDVHGLAATLFECLTLHLPREAASREELLRRIAEDPPARASKHEPGLPRDLVAALEVALDPDPDRRYASASAFAEDLQRILDGRPIVARPPGRVARLVRWVGRNRVASLLIATLVVGLSTTAWLASRLRTEVDLQRVAQLESEAAAQILRRRPLESWTALDTVRRLRPQSQRASGLWMELLGSVRETVRVQCPETGGVSASPGGRRLALSTADGLVLVDVDDLRRSGGDRRDTGAEELVGTQVAGVVPGRFRWLPDDGFLALYEDGSLRRTGPQGGVRWRVERVMDPGAEVPPGLWPGLALVRGEDGEPVEVAVGTADGRVRTLGLGSGEETGVLRAAGPDRRVYVLRHRRLEGGGRGFLVAAGKAAAGPRRGVDTRIGWIDAEDPARSEPGLAETVGPPVSELDVDAATGWWFAHVGNTSARWVQLGVLGRGLPLETVPELPRLVAAWNARGSVRHIAFDDGRLAVAAVDLVYLFDLREVLAREEARVASREPVEAAAGPGADGVDGPAAAAAPEDGGDGGTRAVEVEAPPFVPYREARLSHLGGVASVAFEPGGETLLTATSDGVVRRWAWDEELAVEPILQVPGSQLVQVLGLPGGRVLAFDGENRMHWIEPPPAPFARRRLRYGFAQIQPLFDGADLVTVLPGMRRSVRFAAADLGVPGVATDLVPADERRIQTVGVMGGSDRVETLFGYVRRPAQLVPYDRSGARLGEPFELPRGSWYFARQSRDGERVGTLHLVPVPGTGRIAGSHLGVRRRGADGTSWGELLIVSSGFEGRGELAARFALPGAGDRIVLAGRNGGVWSWEGGAQSEVCWRHPRSLPASACCDLPDGRVVVGFSDGSVHVVDARTGDAEALPRFDAACTYVAAAPDGRSIVAGDATGRLLLVDPEDPGTVIRWRGHGGRVVFASFSADGERLATSARDGTVAVWPTRRARIFEAARAARPREVRLRVERPR